MTVDDREWMPTVQDILDRDTGPQPPKTYRVQSPKSFGLDDIPVDRYTTQEYHDLEMRRLWPRVWQWACLEEDIPNVGDYTVYEIGDYSIIVARSGPDQFSAVHNACLHRGTQLKEGDGNCSSYVCPFHAWQWALDGKLERIPSRWDFPQVSDDEFALPAVKVERWRGFVFVNLDPDARPLIEHLDSLPEHFEPISLEDKVTVANVSKIVPVNWKGVLDAFIESYHVIATHPQILEWAADANSQYDVWETVSRTYTASAVPSPHLGPDYDPEATYDAALPYFVSAFPGIEAQPLTDDTTPRAIMADIQRRGIKAKMNIDLSNVSDAEILDAVQYYVFPNWCPWARMMNGLQYRFRPNGNNPEESIMDVRIMLPVPQDAPRPPAAKVRKLGVTESWTNAPELGALAEVLDQDIANMIRVRRGMRSTQRSGLVFGEYQESRIRHYHKLLDAWLADPDTPAVAESQ